VFALLLVCPSARTSAAPKLSDIWVRDGTVGEAPELPVSEGEDEVVIEVVPSSRGLRVRPWAVEEELVIEVVPSSRGLRVRPWAVELLMLEGTEMMFSESRCEGEGVVDELWWVRMTAGAAMALFSLSEFGGAADGRDEEEGHVSTLKRI
jgi:hypothetical protein